jgi:hypothetical protein
MAAAPRSGQFPFAREHTASAAFRRGDFREGVDHNRTRWKREVALVR